MTVSQADKFAVAFGNWVDTYIESNPSVTFEDLVVGAASVQGTIADLIREGNTQHAPSDLERFSDLVFVVNDGSGRGRLRPGTP